ncbi:MAG TPA: Na+:solute symporter [Verrucomicrobiota bacterium]|nr:Na+:solute symporter [Verrucomicrobiota bacterium]
MHSIDLVVIVAYLILMIGVGAWVTKKAARSAESYFLAGKSLPWWIIGIAHGSSGVDITGTMWFVTMLFVYGVKATWLLWVWPLFNVIFRMMYLGTWVRRSNVLTGAEWMRTRFGKGAGAELAYLSVVLYALVSVVGFLSYAFRGIGKFTKPFVGWDYPDTTYATVIMVVTGLYCIVGGMYSVVLNDLIQYALILVAAVIVAVVAIALTTPEQILDKVPAGWDNLFFGWRLDLDWSHLIPQLQDKLYGAGGDGYALFGFFIGMLFLKGVLVSMAGPTPNYAIQHILSTRSPREAALENLMMALTSLGPRFLLIAGIAVLGIVFFSQDLAAMGAKVDFEVILPAVVQKYLPVGGRGLIVAALLAAFMSTFVSTVNSGAAYVVNDLYKRYVDPQASNRRLVWLGYATSFAVIMAGIGFGFVTQNVHSVTKWVVAALVPAFVAPNVLKWHWWRFNAHGFFAGMMAGTAAALILPRAIPGLQDVYLFLLILTFSFAASILVCLLTAPEDMDVLKRFYRTVRPWGRWGPVLAQCRAEDPALKPNRDFRRDMFNVAIGMVWQTSMVTLPVYLVIQQYGPVGLSLAVLVLTSLILKFTWYDKLGRGDLYLS